MTAPKVIVYMTSLLSLFAVCRSPGCNSAVFPENIRVSYYGAMAEIKATCNADHTTFWQSSPTLGTGRKKVGVLNVLLAVYCLTTGLHISQARIFVLININIKKETYQ